MRSDQQGSIWRDVIVYTNCSPLVLKINLPLGTGVAPLRILTHVGHLGLKWQDGNRLE